MTLPRPARPVKRGGRGPDRVGSLDALGDLPGRRATEDALRQLASVHSDHEDFDKAWA